MAQSPSHKFGQIIGDVVEESIEPLLQDFAKKHELYLDRRGLRAARPGRKVTWLDGFANAHDLDFVFERGGTDAEIGTPIAFIEVAWRRYTKHSRNKAQEIQGAIMPLAEKHRLSAPFKGAVLAGVFTEGALSQLRSLGFVVLHFPVASVVSAFAAEGIDARSSETTPDSEFAKKVRAWNRLSASRRQSVAAALVELNQSDVDVFMGTLERCAARTVRRVVVLPLHGSAFECASLAVAIDFIEGYGKQARKVPAVRYEVELLYDNEDRIDGSFADKASAVQFLHSFEPPGMKPLSRATVKRGQQTRR